MNFKTPDGAIWKYRGVTAFTLLQLFIQDDPAVLSQVADYCNWARSLGANTLRVFGMWSVTNFDPRAHDDYYEALGDLAATLNDRFGLRLHYVAFTDQIAGSPILMSAGEQMTHMDEALSALQGYPNVLIECVNEDWKNGQLAHDFPAEWFYGRLLATRSAFEDGQPPTQAGSLLQFTTEHTPRDSQWARKSKNLLETARTVFNTQRPPICGEPIGIFETNVPGSRSSNARLFADYFAGAELFGAGACLHGDGSTLQRCFLPGPQALQCAAAVSQIWRGAVPADAAAAGAYTRGGLSDCPLAHSDRYDDNGAETDPAGALRTFAMLQGARATALIVDPGPSHHVQAVNGWRVVEQRGPHGQVVLLER